MAKLSSRGERQKKFVTSWSFQCLRLALFQCFELWWLHRRARVLGVQLFGPFERAVVSCLFLYLYFSWYRVTCQSIVTSSPPRIPAFSQHVRIGPKSRSNPSRAVRICIRRPTEPSKSCIPSPRLESYCHANRLCLTLSFRPFAPLPLPPFSRWILFIMNCFNMNSMTALQP